MNENLKPVVEAIQRRFNAQVKEFREEVSLILEPAHLIDAVTALRDEFDFPMLQGATAVDYWPEQNPRFHLIYHFYSMTQNLSICLRVPVDGNSPVMPTLEKVYPNANWHEREIWDMFGIRFDGHSDLRRILMPADWQGHPQRKDYPLGYEEVQFTFNFDQISLKKPAPRE
jgi:NADH-quinone oxidoreductase subunit C